MERCLVALVIREVPFNRWKYHLSAPAWLRFKLVGIETVTILLSWVVLAYKPLALVKDSIWDMSQFKWSCPVVVRPVFLCVVVPLRLL